MLQYQVYRPETIHCTTILLPSQGSKIYLLGANELSGFVARKLSGYYESHKGGFHEAVTSATGDSENGI